MISTRGPKVFLHVDFTGKGDCTTHELPGYPDAIAYVTGLLYGDPECINSILCDALQQELATDETSFTLNNKKSI